MNRTPNPPSTPTRAPRGRPLLLAAAWLGLAAGPAPGQGPPKPPAPGPSLTLLDGGVVPGELADSDRAGAIRWRAAPFAGPFDFPLAAVESARFPSAEAAPRPPGAFGFELTGGDVVFGSLAGLDDKTAELEIPRLGRLRVDRARLARIFRWRDGADLAYNGPNGLAGWREAKLPRARPEPATNRPAAANNMGVVIQGGINRVAAAAAAPKAAPAPPPGPKWREESGQLVTDQEGACLRADLGIPARASVEFELSWKGAPDFVLALGVGDDDRSFQRAFRFEVWEGQVVACRETDGEADLAPLGPAGAGPGRARFRALLDQEAGRLLVLSAAGEALADLKLGGRAGPGLPGVLLASHRGDLRLERLRVARWDGEAPSPPGADRPQVQLVEGPAAPGSVERFDPAAREFVLRAEGGESRVAEARVASVRLSEAGADVPRPVRVAYQDGTRLGGDWVKVEGGALTLACPGIEGPVRLPLEGVRSLDVPRGDRKAPEKDALAGTLEMGGIRMLGHLASPAGGPGLAWRPLGVEAAVPLRPGASGKVVYRAPAPKPATFRVPTTAVIRDRIVMAPPPAPAPAPARRVGGGLLEGLLPAGLPAPPAPPPAASTPARRSLYLRTGDIIPSEVVKIDEEGVTFRTEFSGNTFVPHARVKAVELAAEAGAALRVTKAKRERLLTLPRMQKGSPPTHLIRSKDGDILRGRVVGMDEKDLRVEVRLEEKSVPRDRVARIIWLHADETDPTRKPAPPPEDPRGVRVQAVRTDGIRLTFAADRLDEATLVGRSDVLGDCRVRLAELDQLLIGGAVEAEATQLAYQQWKLQDAPEPRSAQADGGPPDASAGTESAMVGKPAPDFELDLLAGKKFHLAESRGKVVVLDFWATWCGPCLQAMPQIDRATRDFADRGVQLVAVNLQEAPGAIRALLERQKLSPAVALDRDGAVAAKYGANAIPQTVVIDREGKVSRLFIGGGPQLEAQLRAALEALMPGGGEKKP